jgi:glycyl-tRNA synthetase beta chain
VVSNIRPHDASAVIGGNERVVRPRLADAKFFFDQDRKKTLESRVAGLAKVVYHNKLGTQGERIERVRKPSRGDRRARWAATTWRGEADTAARLAKADLLTDMVGEFPELQGIMGGYYARHDGLGDDVADAIEDHYKPRFAGDALPRNTSAWWWRWPTSSRRWPACSPSASCPPATRTRSRCAAMRWASCAC